MSNSKNRKIAVVFEDGFEYYADFNTHEWGKLDDGLRLFESDTKETKLIVPFKNLKYAYVFDEDDEVVAHCNLKENAELIAKILDADAERKVWREDGMTE